MVLQIGTYSVGIMVDRVFDTEEIVVKPVAPILRNITLFSGNTILGDGSVIMILDPNGIAAASGELKMVEKDAHDKARQLTHRSDVSSLLLFHAGTENPKAVPLALVARLEEIDLAKIEYSEGRPLVQYRGQLMPLVQIGEDTKLEVEGRQPVLVFTDDGRSMGLMVDEIVDIVEDRINIEVRPEAPWLMGSAVIAGKATEVIDAGYYLTRAYGDWFGSADTDSQEPWSRGLFCWSMTALSSAILSSRYCLSPVTTSPQLKMQRQRSISVRVAQISMLSSATSKCPGSTGSN